jgi:hypothetical protein
MRADLQGDIEAGLVQIEPVDWAKAISRAEQLSAQHTGKGGYRGFDVLHVAMVLDAGARVFV